ncbi:hypothetical protein [Caudoviricetes sp.]|nr:hypothetical protein [Caudoviricetes sp.]
MNKIKKVAVRKKDGEIKTTKIGNHHIDIASRGKRGFIDNNGKFVNRKEGAKIATKSGQTKEKTKNLHSSQLKK